MDFHRIALATALVAACMTACAKPGATEGDDGGTGESDSGETTGDGTGTEGGSATTGGASDCSMYEQDCPDGEKCNWKVIGTDLFQVCVTIVGDQKLGESCTHEGIWTGIDTCDEEGLCYGAVSIGGPWDGICRPYCGGSEDDPICENADDLCTRGDLPACLPGCDPLVQDCISDDEICFYQEHIPGFVCAFTNDMSDVGEACLVPFDCRKGQTCQAGAQVAGCDSEQCCTDYCDLNAGNTCQAAGMGAECVDMDVGGAFAHVGACLLPE